jgi:hypothetical protein
MNGIDQMLEMMFCKATINTLTKSEEMRHASLLKIAFLRVKFTRMPVDF